MINEHLYSEQYCATSCLIGTVYISHHLSGCGTVPFLAGVGQLCPHGHDVQEAAGTRSEDVCTLAACKF